MCQETPDKRQIRQDWEQQIREAIIKSLDCEQDDDEWLEARLVYDDERE